MSKRLHLWLILVLPLCFPCKAATAMEPSTPEAAIRAVVSANADKDFAAMSRLMAHDDDSINYTIGGRKYVGWNELARDLREEFESVTRLEMPIHELTVWRYGSLAWFVMELDYIRYMGEGTNQLRKVLPLRWLSSLMVGAGVAVALLGLAKQGFSWYVQFAQSSIPLYGALGAFLLFFLWLYYASLVFVLGAEAGWVFEHRGTLEPERANPRASVRITACLV